MEKWENLRMNAKDLLQLHTKLREENNDNLGPPACHWAMPWQAFPDVLGCDCWVCAWEHFHSSDEFWEGWDSWDDPAASQVPDDSNRVQLRAPYQERRQLRPRFWGAYFRCFRNELARDLETQAGAKDDDS